MIVKRVDKDNIPKINQLTAYKDLRPISVTPILSRLFERLIIVNKFILPALPKPLFHESFAFRPSGSTMAALSYVPHAITRFQKITCTCIVFSLTIRVLLTPLTMRFSFVNC